MKNTKHTKGEWSVEAINLIKCNGEQICSTNSMIDEYKENAKLIAAAPFLLEALIKLRKSMVETYKLIGTSEADIERLKIVNEAIKKATK